MAVYDTEDITLKEEALDCIPDDLNASRDGNVNETVMIPAKSFDDFTDDPNLQKVSKNRGSLARIERILENIPKNTNSKRVVVIPLLRSNTQMSAKKERSKKILCKKLKEKYAKEFKCNDCGASFVFKSKLQCHINAVHLKLKPYECNQCKKSFSLKERMVQHAQKIHLNCADCDYSSISESRLKIHLETVHQKARTHKCDQCQKSFSRKGALNTHIKGYCKGFHQKIKAYKCQDCNKNFSNKYVLASHVDWAHLKIDRPKKFICEKCDATFEQKQYIEHHMNKVHLNVKPYECNLCEMSFFIKNQLKTHLKKSHKVKPYECYFCQKAFFIKAKLKTHLKRSHREEEK